MVAPVWPESIDPKARVWTVTMGANGRLETRIDPKRLERWLRAKAA